MARHGNRTGRGSAAIGFLARLRRDARGGAAVMLAAMVVPMLLFVGSAVDVARVYTVKARLQQACDAGVLAGRRVMTDTTNNGTLDATATAQALAFFGNNFHYTQNLTDPNNPGAGAPAWMKTYPAKDPNNSSKYLAVFKASKLSESVVGGTANIMVPMAVMKMFGFQPIRLTATCEARYDVADADIMFVLDQTGSMACQTSTNEADCKTYVSKNVLQDGNSFYVKEDAAGSRIAGLRAEVLTFFDTVTKQADSSTNFRFGFLPYTATANVGRLLQPLGYVKTSADYETRYVSDYQPSSTPTSTSSFQGKASACTSTRSPVSGTFDKDAQNNWYATSTTATYTPGSTANNGTCSTKSYRVVPQWDYMDSTGSSYGQYDTSLFIQGTAASPNQVDNPAQFDSTKSTWTGCVEERQDTSSRGVTNFSMTSPPKDLDPDSAPANAADGWAPWWPDVTFARATSPERTTDLTRTFYSRYYNGSYNGAMADYVGKAYNEVACPLAAKRLTETKLPAGSSASDKTTVRTSIENYLKSSNGFRPYGTTYHDVGMKWGLRLISPTGIFRNDTAAWTGHNPPNRFIIFLTDGDMETDPASDGLVYSEFGMEKYDKRVGNGATGASLDSYHNRRFLASCQMAKNRNIRIFVIAYATALTSDLSTCGSAGSSFTANKQEDLQKAFAEIAQQVAMLRISK